MDCEKFDRIVLDQLYAELDELTGAAAKRHTEHCMRCRRIEMGLRATREVGVLPLEQPPADSSSSIMAAERAAHEALPLPERFGRAISIMAAYAMRPQSAMAALLLLMIGGSLLFLRARPGEHVRPQVAERGVPEGEGDLPASPGVLERPASNERNGSEKAHGILAAPEASSRRERGASANTLDSKTKGSGKGASPGAPAEAPGTIAGGDFEDAGVDVAYEEAMAAYAGGRYADAQHRFEAIAAAGGAKAGAASLLAAQAAKNGAGCEVAASQFDQVANHFPGTGVGNQAAWQAGECYRALGQLDTARHHFRALLSTDYAGRAERVLSELDSTHPNPPLGADAGTTPRDTTRRATPAPSP